MAFKRRLAELVASMISSYPSMAMFWARVLPPSVLQASIPWVEVTKPLGESVLGVVSITDLYDTDLKPFRQASEKGDPTFRALDVNVPFQRLAFARETKSKPPAVLPLISLRKMVKRKSIARLHPWIYSFMTQVAGRNLRSLTTISARAVSKALAYDGVDIVLVLPAPRGEESSALIAREIENSGIPTIVVLSCPDADDSIRPPRTLRFEGTIKKSGWSQKTWYANLTRALEMVGDFDEPGHVIVAGKRG